MRIALAALVLAMPLVSEAASLALLSDGPSYLVGELMTLDVYVSTQAPEGPGELEFTIHWGAGGSSGLWVGAAVLQQPVALGPAFALAPGSSDCSDAVGQASGSCTVRAVAAAPVVGNVPVAQLIMLNSWIAPPGYELCFSPAEPGCVSAGAYSLVGLSDPTLFGVPGDPVPGLLVGSLAADPHVRPIPEPGTAGLVALGFAMLARRARRPGTRASSAP